MRSLSYEIAAVVAVMAITTGCTAPIDTRAGSGVGPVLCRQAPLGGYDTDDEVTGGVLEVINWGILCNGARLEMQLQKHQTTYPASVQMIQAWENRARGSGRNDTKMELKPGWEADSGLRDNCASYALRQWGVEIPQGFLVAANSPDDVLEILLGSKYVGREGLSFPGLGRLVAEYDQAEFFNNPNKVLERAKEGDMVFFKLADALNPGNDDYHVALVKRGKEGDLVLDQKLAVVGPYVEAMPAALDYFYRNFVHISGKKQPKRVESVLVIGQNWQEMGK